MEAEKVYENGPDPFFFQYYGNENGPDSCRETHLSVS